MSEWQKIYREKRMTPGQAAGMVQSGDAVYIGFVSSAAYKMAEALWERRDSLEDVTIISSNILKPTPLFTVDDSNPFRVKTPFMGAWERNAMRNGRPVSYTSFHLSQLDLWFREIGRPNVAFLEVSLPDKDGYMSFGPTGGCVSRYVLETSDRVIVQINENVPYVTGQDCLIHASAVDAVVEASDSLPGMAENEVDPVTREISRQIMELVPDGATVQLGIGKLSTAIGYGLRDRNDLGIHTEMFCTPMMDLMKDGNVTNKQKGFMNGKSVFAFAMGSQAMYEFMDNNDEMYAGLFSYVNDPRIIMQNRRMISINSTMALDIFGQAASDSLGYKQHSAVGGQLDFVRGAQWSEEGKSFIASASSFMVDGVRRSKIVFNFPEGTAITTPRADVQYVVTEYGCVNLKNLDMADRVRAMIGLAHPDFRDRLTQQAKDHHLLY